MKTHANNLTSVEAMAVAQDPMLTPAAAESLLIELEATMDGLISVIEAETQLVRAGALFEAGEFGHEKERLSASYLQVREKVKAETVALAAHMPEAVEALRARHATFGEVLRMNLMALATARDLAEDILRNVSEAVGKRSAPRTYGPAHSVRTTAPAAAHGIAVNRMF